MVQFDITFVRHGETEGNKKGVFVGVTDDPLTPQGREQAKKAGIFLKEKISQFDLCFSSPLKRAKETMEIILDVIDTPQKYIIEPLLRERNYGVFENRSPHELKGEFPEYLEKYKKNKPDTHLPQGETARHVEERINLFFDKLRKEFSSSNRILIVSHLNPLRAMLILLGYAGDEIYSHKFKNASITRFKTDLSSLEMIWFDLVPKSP